ncbi:MAG: NAD-glutamate dehydrogenase [Leptospiraceae bacterium]|nr:NAD-glutamate dehydrogenase [Leptospiraceae bacterium]MCP5497741.1 NAD-glutamate dehydrogenase [Leptospiraceae bacterium]
MNKEFFTSSLSKCFNQTNRKNQNSIESRLWNYYQSIEANPIAIQYSYLNESESQDGKKSVYLMIVYKSTPFVTAKLRRIFYLLHIIVKISLHFHPSEKEEMYYIEINDIEQVLLSKLISNIQSSYIKILNIINDYKLFFTDINTKYLLKWGEEYSEFIQWLLTKGYVWEGTYYLSSAEKTEFRLGNIPDDRVIDWIKALPNNPSPGRYCLETQDSSLIGEGNIFYFAFVNQGYRLLLSGSLSQAARNSALNDIPILKRNLHKFIAEENIQYNSGLGRTVRMMFNYMPKELLFLIPEHLYRQIFSSLMEHSLRTEIHSSFVLLNHGLVLFITFVPEKKWSEEKWKQVYFLIQKEIPNCSLKDYEVYRDKIFEGFLIVRNPNIDESKLPELASQIEYLFMDWMDQLKLCWEKKFNENFDDLNVGYWEDYKATHSPEKAIQDLELVKNLGDDRVIIDVTQLRNDTTVIHAVTKNLEFSLSLWVTALTSLSLSPISQRVYRFMFGGEQYAKSEFFFDYMEDKDNLYNRLQEAISLTLKGALPCDTLSGVLPKSNLDANGLFFLKSVRDYCIQGNSSFHVADFNDTLVKYPEFCSIAWEYFQKKFQNGKPASEKELKEISDKAKTIKEDEVLSSFRTTVLSILRTNFFGLGSKDKLHNKIGVYRNSVAYKIDSSIPISLPLPRPYREIFVYASNFQGIHLRGGTVARGGLRFSDRPSDYRTEILSLMKTQMVKNTLIVPVGSKGGFVITNNLYRAENILPIDVYKSYISSLLSLTDNRTHEKILPFAEPNGPFAYDEIDPYLVVAADKGTASFSDVANSISQDNRFWLDDAFASGGSMGYSHKDLGITAKGALVNADRLFRYLGVDFRAESITVVGIGDMGGDVFGNGLLESKYFKLVAAFNHKHIFLDPNPDPEKSYQERLRLFRDKNSGWDFYNKELLSQGGGIFDKTEKAILLSSEIQKVLGLEESTLSGEALIKAILKAPVDMLYNGGIGTYVKSESEENTKVGDPTNNEYRINGNELRAKVVSEGGNLGLTQLGRIEYAIKGGNIYTDALDNSGGVDLSDHEVNLKIFFNYLKERGTINSLEDRNKILKDVTEEVVNSVLLNNALQSLVINIDHYETEKNGWDDFIKTSFFLVRNGTLHPSTEKIPPTLHDWDEWKKVSKNIPKPALCVLLAYTKMYLYSNSMEVGVFQPENYQELYLHYFPKLVKNNYKDSLFAHPLKKEILTTQVVNYYVNFLGINGILLLAADSQNKIGRFKEIFDNLYELKIPFLMDELTKIRDKSLEKELVEFVFSIREKIKQKWSIDTSSEKIFKSKFYTQLSSDSKGILERLL